MQLSRRAFLKLTGATGAAVTLDGNLRIFTPARAAAAAEQLTTLHQVCEVCSGNCAILARVKDDRIFRLEGNPDDQVSGGKLCVKGYRGLNLLYDPDRLKYPLKRTNSEKGIGVDPKWVKIGWDEALDTVAKKFSEVRDKHGSKAIALIARPNDWSFRLAKSIGTPNHIAHINTCYSTHETVWGAMVTGKGRPWTTDYANSRFILAFGWDQPGKAKNVMARHFLEARERGARVVILDPRLTTTASKADEWLPIKPGTDLAFALAMINVIVKEGLYDREFVARYTAGFDELAGAVESYTPEWASKLTEIPAETITRVAREFAKTRPAVIATHKRDAGGPNYVNSWRLSQAGITLMALVGSIDRPGGVIFERTPKLPSLDQTFPPPEYKLATTERVDGLERFPLLLKVNKGSFSTVAEGILSEKPYPVKAALANHHNVLAFPNPNRMVEALKQLEFLAVVDVYPSEMVQLADIVLPDAMYLERGGINVRKYFAMYPQIALKQAVKPIYDTKTFSAITLAILDRMGLGDYTKGVSGAKLQDAQMAAVGSSMEALKASPNGLWGEKKAFVPREEFGTESKKIELHSTALKKLGYDPLPRWEPARASTSADYPFHLLIYRKPWERMTENQNDPMLRQIYPEDEALLHTSVGKRLGIASGDNVKITSSAGSIQIKARLVEGIRSDCVAVDHGFGHWSKELTVAQGRGACDGDLIPNATLAQQLEVKDPGMGAYMEDLCVDVARA